jgi:hypothetical protein
MKRRVRDFRKEYINRVTRGLAKGYSRARARGHARAGDIPRPKTSIPDPGDPRERALKLMKAGATQKAAAKSAGVSVEKLRRYMKENTSAKRQGRTWTIIDRRPVMMVIASQGQIRWIGVRKKAASKIGHYWNEVNKFLETNDVSHLKPFENRGVRDANRKYHPWETSPNTLRKLDSIGELSFIDIYRNTAN